VPASRLRDVYCLKHSEDLVEKMISLLIFDTNRFIQTVKCSFFSQIIVYQSFPARRSTLVIFSSSKSSVFRHAPASRLRDVCCLKHSACWENDISGYIWHKPFIQMVNYSFLDERIVYQSFYGASLNFSYFFFK